MQATNLGLPATLDLGYELQETGGVNWTYDIVAKAFMHGTHVVKAGRGPGSLEDEDTAGLDYIVLTTSGVRAHLTWLYKLYMSLAVRISRRVGETVVCPDSEGAINVNCLPWPGDRYELHVDSSPYTLLVGVTTHLLDGALWAMPPGGEKIVFKPEAGLALLFDGESTPHQVQPVAHAPRVTVPMLFVPERLQVGRDASLDGYLYASRKEAEHANQ